MGTQGTGRKRSTKKERSTAEDDALNLIAREAEARLAAKRAARAEAREIRMKELERQQKELSDDDERMSVGSRGSVRVEDRDYLEKGSRAASALTAATLTSLGGSSSRRGSGETSVIVDAENSIREIKEIHELKDQIQDVETKYTQNLKEAKDALAEVEEKYRKAMVSNAQLDNEKNNLMYQVDTLKDSLMELEELLSESRREYTEKVKEHEREKHAHSVLQFQFNEMKETLKQSEELLNEIRQLRLKQEGFVREISDLQETVEWKDKKIGALERQKEYTDAIRIERDELREEVVTLKDILKKHGIVLGPDLSINGEVGEAEADGSPSSESQSAPDSQSLPAEGNSMLGKTEETELRSSREEEEKEVDPEQQQEKLQEEAKENHLSSEALCNVADESTLETSGKEEPSEEQQTCLPVEEDSVGDKGLSHDLNVDVNDCPTAEAKDLTVCSAELPQVQSATCPEVNGPEREICEVQLEETGNQELETETKSSSDDIRETSSSVASVTATSNTEPQQEPENVEDAENDEAEETASKSKVQGTPASGKKKKRKKKGKKKAQENKNQQKDGPEEENGKKEDVIAPAAINSEPTTQPDVHSSVEETVTQSKVDAVKNEENEHKTEEVSPQEDFKEPEKDAVSNDLQGQALETQTLEKGEEVETVVPSTENDKGEHSEEIKEMAASAEKVEATEDFSHVETPNESVTETLEMEKVEDPDPETPSPPDNLISTNKESDVDAECTVSGDNCNGEPVSTDGAGSHTVSETTHQVEDESADDVKCAASNLGDDKDDVVNESESTSQDDAPVPEPPLTDSIDASKSSPDSENSLMEVPSEEPDEATEAVVADDVGARVEAEPESIPPVDVSPGEDGDNPELEQDGSGGEELSEGVREPEGAVETDGPSHDGKHESDGESLAKDPEASAAEEAVERDEQLDDAEGKTAEDGDQTDTSHAEAPLKTEDAVEVGSSTEQDTALLEDAEHKSSQGEESESTSCPLAEELPESGQDKCGDAEEDEDEDEEGQSFDFDDMDVEAAVACELPENPKQEEIEEAVEVLPDESKSGGSGSNENAQDETAESNNGKEKEPQENSVEDAASQKVVNVSEEQRNVSKEDAAEQTHVTGQEEVANVVPENLKRASLLVEEGLEAIKHDTQQGQGSDLPKSEAQDGSKEAAQSGRDGKKGSKKSKGKTKEECKMS